MAEIKVSVIIPCYNSSFTIEKTLKSVLNQDFKDFEIIIVDDNSMDNTVSLVNNLLSRNSVSYKIIQNNKNKGPSFSRNRGIESSEGQYLVFVDSDDLISINHISNLYNNLKSPSDAVFVNLLKVNGDFSIFDYNEDGNLSFNYTSSYELIKSELLMRFPFSFTQLIYNKNLIKFYNIYFNESINYGEDTDFALRYLVHVDKVVLINETSYFYNQNSNSLSSTSYFERFDFVTILENLVMYYDDLLNNEISKQCLLSKYELNNLKSLLITSRIPKSIFGNLMFLFYKNCSFEEINLEMEKRDLFAKLEKFESYDGNDKKFSKKLKIFLKNPKVYYKFWKKLKDSV